MSGDIRPNFRLAENDNQRCANCSKVAFDDNSAAHCMLEAAGADAASGKRVNQNFVCDTFSAK